MKKIRLLLTALIVLFSVNAFSKDFYELDNAQAEAILKIFYDAYKDGRNYPNEAEFKSIGLTMDNVEFIRSHVKRNQLVNTEDRFNKKLYKDRKVYMCIPMGSGAQGATGYPTNEFEKTDTYSMWNYTATFGSWNHGFFSAPGSWADAAHKNGCKLMSGQMFFESNFGGADDRKWVELISQKEGGEYKWVIPMINALMYFGHDGLVYNWEAGRFTDKEVIKFHQALYREARKRGFMDYNSTIYNNTVFGIREAILDAVIGTKENPTHELFCNYLGGYITNDLAESQRIAKEKCGGTERLYGGVHFNLMNKNWTVLDDPNANEVNLICWGEHTENMIYTHTAGNEGADWQTNYQDMQERFFTGGNQNLANQPSKDNAATTSWEKKIVDFCGVSAFMPERSAIAKAFLTHFNLGNGEAYFFNGKKIAGGYYNMASQDLVPTYRWLIVKPGTETAVEGLKAKFVYDDVYVGGSCLHLEGRVDPTDVILYKTAVALGDGAMAKVALKNKTAWENADVKLVLRVDGEWKEYAIEGITNEWAEKTIDLSAIQGKTIERVALRVNGTVNVNVGKIELNDNKTVVPAAVKEIKLAQTVAEKTDRITVKLFWTVDAKADAYGRTFNDENNIDHFEIFMKKDGETVEVGRTSQWATIAANLPFVSGDELEVGVCAVSTDLKTKSEIVWTKVKRGTPDKEIDVLDTSENSPYYKINYHKDTPHSRQDRYMMHVGLYKGNNVFTAGGDYPTEALKEAGLQKYPDNDYTSRITKNMYLDATDKVVFDAVAGETYTPYIAYHGLWMSGYVYVDWNNNGQFDYDKDHTFSYDGKIQRKDMCEIVSFNAYQDKGSSDFYNSEGKRFPKSTQFPKDDNLNPWLGSFTVPKNLPEGVYRMRFKLDWNYLGSDGNLNFPDKKSVKGEMYADGGDFIDVMLNVHKPTSKVGAKAENGKVMLGAKELTEAMNGETVQCKPFDLTFTPAEGFNTGSATVKFGYMLNGEQKDKFGNTQWWTGKVDVLENKCTVPANMVKGDVLVLPAFFDTAGIDDVNVSTESIMMNDVYNLNGQLVRKAGSKATLPAGIYVVKDRKFVVK